MIQTALADPEQFRSPGLDIIGFLQGPQDHRLFDHDQSILQFGIHRDTFDIQIIVSGFPETLRKVGGRYDTTGTHYHEAFEEVFELADISRPTVLVKEPFDRGIDTRHRDRMFPFSGVLFYEMIDQQADILLTLLE